MSEHRDRTLADHLVGMVNAWCVPLCTLVVITDGWASRLRRAFREQWQRAGKRGRCQMHAWPEIVSGTVITTTANKCVVDVLRRMAQGILERVEERIARSAGGIEVQTADHPNDSMGRCVSAWHV